MNDEGRPARRPRRGLQLTEQGYVIESDGPTEEEDWVEQVDKAVARFRGRRRRGEVTRFEPPRKKAA